MSDVRRTATVAAAAAAVACLVPAARAGSGGEKIALVRADVAAAHAALVRRSDLREAVWTGGPIKPDLSPPPRCRNYHPKKSDLVLTGVAESSFAATPVRRALDSEVKILRTARMVSLGWRREVMAPGVLACQRHQLAASMGTPGARVVSFGRIPFPRVARYVAQFRGVVALQGQTTRLVVDSVLVSRGRSEISITSLAPLAARAKVTAEERRLVRLMLSRLKA